MGIQKVREEFEKLPEIAKLLLQFQHKFINGNYIVRYNAEIGEQINLAWYAFKEQQAKIDEIKSMAENWINQDYTYNSDSTDIKIQQMKDCGRDIIRKINGELK